MMTFMRKGVTKKLFGIFSISLLFLFFFLAGGCCQDSKERLDNIEAFTRLYGYVKYFYPGDEAAALDWDRFAVYGVKQVETARDGKELKKRLEELFLPIAPALVIHESGQKTEFSMATITPPDTGEMKLVAWQHKGVGFGKTDGIYKSVRLNRETVLNNNDSFGTLVNRLDATPYRGKEIRMRAAVKVAKGIGQLWLRVDKARGQMGFFDNMDDRPIQPQQWNHYEIQGPVAEDAENIFFGCFLRGSGQLWVDDFQLETKEKTGGEWIPVTINNPGFEEDTEGKAPKEWAGNSMGPGYSFLVTSAEAAAGKKSVFIESRTTTLKGPLPDFKPQPEFGETIAKELGAGLSCIMPIALYGTDTFTYPRPDQKKLQQLLTALKNDVPRELTAADLGVRLADITIAWNVFQHFFPYFDVVKTDWSESLITALHDAYQDKTGPDFLKTLKKFTAGLKDSHVRITLKGDDTLAYSAPIRWDWIEDQLVITAILDNTLTTVRMGDIVSSLDGVKARQAYENQEQYVSAATEGWKRYRTLNELLQGPKDSNLSLTIIRDGKEHQITLPRSLTALQHHRGFQEDTAVYKKITEGIHYLNLAKISMAEINKLMPELEKARAIICDLRGYPNGNDGLINHLLKEKENSRWMGIPQVIYPDYQKVTYQWLGWDLEPVEPALTAKMVFIINGRAISYAESYIGYIEGFKLATIVGQPTAGTNGNVNTLTLPGGYTIRWTGMRVVKHDGSTHHGIGIIPDVRVERTIQGVKQGRDEFLEKALEIAEK